MNNVISFPRKVIPFPQYQPTDLVKINRPGKRKGCLARVDGIVLIGRTTFIVIGDNHYLPGELERA